MSLVNDMLKDLDARRAAGEERASLAELHAADEADAYEARQERKARWRRATVWLTSLVVLGVFVGLMIGRYVNPPVDLVEAPAAPVSPPVEAVSLNQVLDVLPQNDGRRFILQLLLGQSTNYQRVDENGAVSLRLPDTRLASPEPATGRIQQNGNSLSWRVEQQGSAVQVLFVGLGGEVQVNDRLERIGDRWQLWLEVPLAPVAEDPRAGTSDDMAEQPALPQDNAEPEALPAWSARSVPAARDPSQAPAEPREGAAVTLPAVAPVSPVVAPEPRVSIASHRVDPLTEARQALLNGDYPRAIAQLEGLNQARPNDAETARWLARGYLAAGAQSRLLAWLPAQLPRFPNDAELRVLLARAQMQSGDSSAAVATLRSNPPALAQDPTYHALLAAAYQQTGQWRDSAALYRLLLGLRPREGAWQLGMAIALEQIGEGRQAASYYALAQQNTSLDDNARRFAADRARILGGQP